MREPFRSSAGSLPDPRSDPTVPPSGPAAGTRTRIVLATDIRLFREGLVLALAGESDLEVVGTVARPEEVLGVVRDLSPDVALLDVAIPGGLELLRDVATLAPDTRVLALAIAEEDQDVIACARAGAVGYVPRNATLEELVTAIRCAVRGELLCSRRMAANLFLRVAALPSAPPVPGEESPLSSRELEVAQLLGQGLSNKQIARRLSIEITTVKNHVHRILEKLQVSRRGEAAAVLYGQIPARGD